MAIERQSCIRPGWPTYVMQELNIGTVYITHFDRQNVTHTKNKTTSILIRSMLFYFNYCLRESKMDSSTKRVTSLN